MIPTMYAERRMLSCCLGMVSSPLPDLAGRDRLDAP